MKYYTYQEINYRSGDEGPVTSKMSICKICTQDRSDPDGADPVGDIISRLHSSLMELFGQIHYQI